VVVVVPGQLLARKARLLRGLRRLLVAADVMRIRLQLLRPAEKGAEEEAVAADLRLHAMLPTRLRAKKRPKAIVRAVEAEEEATVVAEVKAEEAVVKAEVAVVADHLGIVTRTKTAGSISSITWTALSTRKSNSMKRQKFQISQHPKTV
jgi:chromatin segregation and condensation protein Rec8/ScpA/Scc1 (kleisin family)